jgi:hypothetical protein
VVVGTTARSPQKKSLGYGLHAQGVPIGDRGFVQWELRRLVGKAGEKIVQVRSVLASMPSKQFHLHTVNLYCFTRKEKKEKEKSGEGKKHGKKNRGQGQPQ